MTFRSRWLFVPRVLSMGFAFGCGPHREDRPPLGFSPAEMPDGVVGKPYSVKIAVTNTHTPVCNIGIAGGTLPGGLKFEKADDGARVSGTPVQAGRFEFTVFASCYGTQVTGQSGHRVYRIRILDGG